MVAPIGRKPIQTPPPAPKTEPKKVATDAEQLQQLLGDIGKKLETAWNNAINPPAGATQTDPLLRFLSEFTNTPLAQKVETPAAQTTADAQKIAARQAQKKDSLGFSVSEPEPAPVQKKDETPVEPQKPGEIAKPTKEFTETAARIAAAREDGVATKAEAGAMIYTMAQEIKLARAAGVPQDEIAKTLGRMFAELSVHTALSTDLIAESENISAQVGLISMMGDNPEGYEKLGLQLLGGKPPEPVKIPTPKVFVPIEDPPREGGGDGEGGVQFVMGANGQPVSIEQQYQRTHPNANVNGGGNQNDTRLRQDQQRRTEERRREDTENAGKGGGGGVDQQQFAVEQQQTLTRQDTIRQAQDQQRLQDALRQMDDQQRRDDQNRRR